MLAAILPAYSAGLSNGTRIVAVNGRRFSNDEVKRALRIDCHGGLRYPHLERVAGAPDVLTAIAAPGIK